VGERERKRRGGEDRTGGGRGEIKEEDVCCPPLKSTHAAEALSYHNCSLRRPSLLVLGSGRLGVELTASENPSDSHPHSAFPGGGREAGLDARDARSASLSAAAAAGRRRQRAPW